MKHRRKKTRLKADKGMKHGRKKNSYETRLTYETRTVKKSLKNKRFNNRMN